MANTIDSDLYGSIVGENAIRVMQDILKPVSAFSTDFSGEIGNRNESIVVPLSADPSSPEDKSAGSDYTDQDTTINETTVTLNKHKYTSWYLTDNDTNTSRFMSIENVGMEKGQKLAIGVLQDILSLVTNSNYGSASSTTAASGFDHSEVVSIQTDCDNDNWPMFGRNLILTPSYYNSLFDDSVTGADVYGSALVARGELPQLAGFDMHKLTAVPGNSENLVGFAARPNAMALVNRYLAPAGGGRPGSIYRSFTHEQTGLTIGYREFYDDQAGVRKAILECWYGFSTGNTSALKRIVSA